MANPLVNFRLDDESKARWEAVAASEGLPLSAFIRRCVEDAILLGGNALVGGGDGMRDLPVAPAPSAKPKRSRAVRQSKDVPAPSAASEAMAAAVSDAVTKAAGGGRKQMCEHRIPADRYCARCDA